MSNCPKCNKPTYNVKYVDGMNVCPDCQLYIFEKRLLAWADLTKAATRFKDTMGEDFDIHLTLEEIRRTLMEGDSK